MSLFLKYFLHEEEAEQEQGAYPEQQEEDAEYPQEQYPEDDGQMQYPGDEQQMDPNAPPPMDPEQEELNRQLQIKQVRDYYILRRIYQRLSSLETILDKMNTREALQLKDKVQEMIEYIQMYTLNDHVYQPNVDEIIQIFFDFLDFTTQRVAELHAIKRHNDLVKKRSRA